MAIKISSEERFTILVDGINHSNSSFDYPGIYPNDYQMSKKPKSKPSDIQLTYQAGFYPYEGLRLTDKRLRRACRYKVRDPKFNKIQNSGIYSFQEAETVKDKDSPDEAREKRFAITDSYGYLERYQQSYMDVVAVSLDEVTVVSNNPWIHFIEDRAQLTKGSNFSGGDSKKEGSMSLSALGNRVISSFGLDSGGLESGGLESGDLETGDLETGDLDSVNEDGDSEEDDEKSESSADSDETVVKTWVKYDYNGSIPNTAGRIINPMLVPFMFFSYKGGNSPSTDSPDWRSIVNKNTNETDLYFNPNGDFNKLLRFGSFPKNKKRAIRNPLFDSNPPKLKPAAKDSLILVVKINGKNGVLDKTYKESITSLRPFSYSQNGLKSSKFDHFFSLLSLEEKYVKDKDYLVIVLGEFEFKDGVVFNKVGPFCLELSNMPFYRKGFAEAPDPPDEPEESGDYEEDEIGDPVEIDREPEDYEGQDWVDGSLGDPNQDDGGYDEYFDEEA